jgi:Subtilase family
MAIDPTKPLLRLQASDPKNRTPGSPRNPARPQQFSVAAQNASFGPRFRRLETALNRDPTGLTLQSDPAALAPERLLVFELRGAIATFANAIRSVPGLELIDEEELEGDEDDKAPEAYLLVPDAEALRNILSLWQRWIAGRPLGTGFTPWRDVFATLRDLRIWGPRDRVQEGDQEILTDEIQDLADDDEIKVEVELVFRAGEDVARAAEAIVTASIRSTGGRVVSRCRIPDIAYHALLAVLPVAAVRSVVERSPQGISGLDPVMHIRPQSMVTDIETNEAMRLAQTAAIPASERSPILALLDGVPVSEHPLLRGWLVVNDLFGLEPDTLVANRTHGTAMASLIVHGDRNLAEPLIERRLHCIPVLGAGDEFPDDKLIVDLIYQAVFNMRDGAAATSANVLIVNLSLGNLRKPFHGKLSPWARLLDRLAHRYGILFLVSAGNYLSPFEIASMTSMGAFEAALPADRAEYTLRALAQLITSRRLLSPSETVNGITVGAANLDAVQDIHRRGARGKVDPYFPLRMANPSSALGPGFANSVKPDILMPGSREHLSMVSSGRRLSVKPSGAGRPHGIKVAAPPRGGGGTNWEHFTGGTSAAAALTSRLAHRIHDALEDGYGETFLNLPHHQRAVLIKALLVHTASWPDDSAAVIKEILGPADNRQSVRQKDNIRRFLGYGLVDADAALSCAEDRATFWAVGALGREKKCTVEVPIPACLGGKAQLHSMHATLAWFTPVLPGRQSYRSVKLSLLVPEDLSGLRVEPTKIQPDINQSSRGTVFSRRWEGRRAPTIGANDTIEISIQREPDRGAKADEAAAFGLAVSISMPGVVEVYDQARVRLGLPILTRPAVRV